MEHHHAREHPAACAGISFPVVYRLRSDVRIVDSPVSEEEARYEREESESRLYCKMCGNRITSDAEGIVINGSHEHICRNPAGMIFNVGCFSNARGCLEMGEFTDEFTWFPGYAWCYLICSSCKSHLGWRYRSHDGGFFGLILDLLERG